MFDTLHEDCKHARQCSNVDQKLHHTECPTCNSTAQIMMYFSVCDAGSLHLLLSLTWHVGMGQLAQP